MRHLAQIFAHKHLKHIKHPISNLHKKHLVKGRGTPAIKKQSYEVAEVGNGFKKHLKPLKFKF